MKPQHIKTQFHWSKHFKPFLIGSPAHQWRFSDFCPVSSFDNVAPMNGRKTPRELGLLPRSFDHRTRKDAVRERKLFKKRFVTIAFVSNYIFSTAKP